MNCSIRRIRKYLAIAAAIQLLVSWGFAQQPLSISVPALIRYGGVLKDEQGTPVLSVTTGVTFAIYKQQDGGAPIWVETQNVTADATGNFSVLLGSTIATGLPSDLFSQQEQRWLGVQLQGQAEQPRVLLVSVPYAFKAQEAETLGGKSVSDFVLANDTNSPVNSGGTGPAASSRANNPSATTLGTWKGTASQGPTNFSGSTTDQIIKLTQSGTGSGVNAAAPTNALFGIATAASGVVYGVQGSASGTGGIALAGNATSATGATFGLKGASASVSGTGMRGLASATTGHTIGVSSQVNSPDGTAALFNNAAGGKIISGQDNGMEIFSLDGSGMLSATSLLASGIVDGEAPVTVTTGATASLGAIYNSGYVYNQDATAAEAVTYTLPTAAAGKQYCIGNSYNGLAANTGILELATSAPGQFIIYNGAISATGGYVISSGAAGDKACVVGVDLTHWEFYPQLGTWTLH